MILRLLVFLAAAWAASSPSAAQTAAAPPRILESTSERLKIIDGGDARDGFLVAGLNPDTYVVHPSLTPKTVSVITDRGRIDLIVAPGDSHDFAIRYGGRLYNQRVTSVDPSPPFYLGAASRSRGVDVIPFMLGPENSIHITTSVNGSAPLDLTFDTGASITVLGESARLKGARMKAGETNRIEMAGVVIERLPMISIEGGRRRSAEQMGEVIARGGGRAGKQAVGGEAPADGLIGYDVFASKVVEIDHDGGVLRIHHDRPDISGYGRIPIRWRGSATLVPLTIEANGEARTVYAQLDTGSNFSLTLNHRDPLSKSLGDLGLESLRRGTKSDGKSIWMNVITIPAVGFGGHRLTDVQADVARSSSGAVLDENLIGNDFLKRFDLIIDYRSSELFARPNDLVAERYKTVLPIWPALGGAVAIVTVFVLGGWALIRRRGQSRKNLGLGQ